MLRDVTGNFSLLLRSTCNTSGKYAEVMRAKCLEAYGRAQGSSLAGHDHVKDY